MVVDNIFLFLLVILIAVAPSINCFAGIANGKFPQIVNMCLSSGIKSKFSFCTLILRKDLCSLHYFEERVCHTCSKHDLFAKLHLIVKQKSYSTSEK